MAERTTIRREDETMLSKIHSIVTVLVDVILVLAKCFWSIGEVFYEKWISPPSEKSVAGEVVLITGAGHGIGREIAIQYALLGSVVVCLDINSTGNEETKKIINEMGIECVYTYSCDVSSREEVLEVVKKINHEVGQVTVLVNNAGIMPCLRFTDHKPETIRKIFDVNVFAHFWFLEAILPSMVQRNHGHVVGISSMCGITGLRNLVPYCSSKFAVRGLMEGVAEELREEGTAPNVHFTSIYPYMVDTGLCKKPKMRFPSLLPLQSPKETARIIVQSMRTNKENVSIPGWLLPFNNFTRLLPTKAFRPVKDFFEVVCEAD